MQYRRVFIPGSGYFFTLVTEGRQKIFMDETNVEMLREACRQVMNKRPFVMDAAVNRYWEHLLRDELDLKQHVNYIHYNHVKHSYVNKPADWKYSSFHRANLMILMRYIESI